MERARDGKGTNGRGLEGKGRRGRRIEIGDGKFASLTFGG